MELIAHAANGKSAERGGSNRPHLIIRASLDTVAGTAGAAAGELEHGGTVPAETVRRLACDSAITRIVGLGELEAEISRASRTIQPSTRRALAVRDRHCVFASCDRPPVWCDGHHLKFWGDGGPTTLENLALLCRPHHRKVQRRSAVGAPQGWAIRRNPSYGGIAR